MDNYIPRPGSAAEAALAFIRKNGGSARSKEIAQAIGIEQKNVSSVLVAAVDSGMLVTCEIATPGAPPQKEYRLSAGGKPISWREPKPARSPVAPPRSEAQEAPEAARRTAPIERRQPGGKLITGEAARGMAAEAAKPARKPRKAREPAQPRPRGAGRRKAAGGGMRAMPEPARKVQRETANRPQIIPENIPGQEPIRSATNFRCGVFSDGTLELVLADGSRVELPPEDTRALCGYLDQMLARAAA